MSKTIKDTYGDSVVVSGERFVEMRSFCDGGRNGYTFMQLTPAKARTLAAALLKQAERAEKSRKVQS